MSRLRVAVDATAIPAQRVGAGVYIVELLRAVEATEVDLHVFVKERDATELGAIAPQATLHPARIDGRAARIAWSYSFLPSRVRRLKPDVFHGPHYTLPAGLRRPSVVTFHDPTFFTLPKVHERKKVAYFTRAARSGIARATRVIAVSGHARQGAIEHAGAEPSRVDVVFNGVDLKRYRPADGPPKPFLLFVGALEPRKDLPTLISAFASLGLPYELVLAGPQAWGTAAVDAAIADASGASIRKTGYVSEPEKIALYQNASAFVYPSLAEGFGLPVLEAMACGTPVVTTTGSAPEEIAGDAAILVPPGDEEALRDALSRVLTDGALASRLRLAGPQRAQRFSWSATARGTADVWHRASRQG